jgi:hypothetical protein
MECDPWAAVKYGILSIYYHRVYGNERSQQPRRRFVEQIVIQSALEADSVD